MTTKILKQIENVRMYLREQRIHYGIAQALDEIAEDIRTHLASPVPDGWVMVPREPTREMRNAGRQTLKGSTGEFEGIQAEMVYKMMLNAAPPAPKEQQE